MRGFINRRILDRVSGNFRLREAVPGELGMGVIE